MIYAAALLVLLVIGWSGTDKPVRRYRNRVAHKALSRWLRKH